MKAARPLAVLALSLLLAARSDAGDPEAKPDEHGFLPLTAEPPDVHDVTGRYGGTLTWCEVGEMTTFNPVVTSASPESELRDLVFDPLVTYDNQRMEFEPALAWKWEHSEDGLTWTFFLRKGVKWSDGQPFTADDVLFSFDAMLHPKVANSIKDGFRVDDSPYPTYEKVDDFTVRFKCPVLNALFLMHVGNLSIMPKHLWADSIVGDTPTFESKMKPEHIGEVVGTGPYRIAGYRGAESITYERNPYSWKVDKAGNRLPYLDRAIVLLAKDLSTRTEQFLAKGFDMVTDIPPQDYKRFKDAEKDGWFKLHRLGLSLNVTWTTFNQYPGADGDGKPYVAPHKLAWFQDVRFRRAMSHAVDRDKMVKILLDGKGEAIYEDTNKGNKAWYSDHTKYPYDVAAANKLLDEMGLTARDEDGIRKDAAGHRVELDVITNVENPLRGGAMDQVKADWAAVGVGANTSRVQFNDLVNSLQDTHRWECIILGWASGVPPEPLNGLNIHLSSGRLHAWYPMQPKPANAWEEENDAMLNAMSKQPDEQMRKPMWAKFTEHAALAQNQIFLFSQNAYAASTNRVMNLRPSVLRPETWHNMEEIWLEDGK